MFFTLMYMKREAAKLTGNAAASGSAPADGRYGLKSTSKINMYSAWDFVNGPTNPFASPGMDITLDACFAFLPVLDIGTAFSHIPLVPSIMRYKTSIDLSGMSFYTPDIRTMEELANRNIGNDSDARTLIRDAKYAISGLGKPKMNIPGNFDEMFDADGNASEQVMRPTRFDVYALIKPFRTPLLVLRPNLGGTFNTIFADGVMFNWGLSVQYNAPRFFSASVGTSLTDGVWSNQLGIALDFRYFELDFGAAFNGISLTESWVGHGLAAFAGIKFGY
jgi:hypothetical protein